MTKAEGRFLQGAITEYNKHIGTPGIDLRNFDAERHAGYDLAAAVRALLRGQAK